MIEDDDDDLYRHDEAECYYHHHYRTEEIDGKIIKFERNDGGEWVEV